MADSTIIRGHSQAAGAKGGDSQGGFWSIARGGFTSKIHARTDGQERPIGFLLTGGEVSDYRMFETLLNLPLAKPQRFLADKGYDGDSAREALLLKGINGPVANFCR